MRLLGLDVGGTKVESTIVEVHGHTCDEDPQRLFEGVSQRQGTFSYEVLDSRRIPTGRTNSYEAILRNIVELCRGQMQALGSVDRGIDGIGIGLPGSIDPLSKKMTNGNSLVFRDHNFMADLSKALDWQGPVAVDNDANCFLRGEVTFSSKVAAERRRSERPSFSAVGVILGTGVGASFYADGQYLLGRHGSALELGHIELWSAGLSCYCGGEGCVEQYLSGPALEAAYACRLYQQIERRPSSKEIFSLARAGEPLAVAVVKKYRRDLVKFCAQITQIFDPELIVFGGGMSESGLMTPDLQDDVAKLTFSGKSPKIRKQGVGECCGSVGAAALVL